MKGRNVTGLPCLVVSRYRDESYRLCVRTRYAATYGRAFDLAQSAPGTSYIKYVTEETFQHNKDNPVQEWFGVSWERWADLSLIQHPDRANAWPLDKNLVLAHE